MSAPIPLRRILMRRGYAAWREDEGCPAGLPTNITIIPLAPKCPELNLVGRLSTEQGAESLLAQNLWLGSSYGDRTVRMSVQASSAARRRSIRTRTRRRDSPTATALGSLKESSPMKIGR